ncbi:MAG: hypothetical protein AAF823_08045 [Planctomycetota bacterium]
MSVIRFAAFAAALPFLSATAHADSLLSQRIIDVSVNDNQGPTYSAFYRLFVGDGSLSLFNIELDETTSPGTIYTFASPADAPNYDFFTDLLTDDITQFANFQILESGGASFPVNIIESESEFFDLPNTDFAGETISKIEFEVFDYSVDLIAAPAAGTNGSPIYEVDFNGAIRVFGPNGDPGVIVPTPTGAALGLAGIVGLCSTRRRRG